MWYRNSGTLAQSPVVIEDTLSGDVNVAYTSFIPTGVHQIAGFIIATVANSTSFVLNTLQAQLQDKLNTFVKIIKTNYGKYIGQILYSDPTTNSL